jgi:hypothetical protein
MTGNGPATGAAALEPRSATERRAQVVGETDREPAILLAWRSWPSELANPAPGVVP